MTAWPVEGSVSGPPRYGALVAALSGIVVAALGVSIVVGYAPIDLGEAIADALAGRPSLDALVLIELRLPRALIGALVGFSLGLAGAAMQGLLRNPLADAGVIGVSGAAAFGAVMAFYSGLSASFGLALPIGGVLGAGAAVAALYALAGRGPATMTLILAGVAINSLAGALTALALNLSPNPYAAMEVMFWLMGSLADRSMTHVQLAAPLLAAGWLMILASGPALDALTLGEDTATSLGFDMSRVRGLLIVGTALAVGASVAVAGAIGFVGLVAPHLLRPLVGGRPGRLLLVSGLGGAALVLAADIGVRLVGVRPELKLGVVTALIGAPFFLSLLWRLRREA
ncbi:FecCD family ABC transporter permease [Hansschlegelia plantiphila]|uniref:ABC transporter permease n=1 Tax=Hansschlegelia plantiphila TaxID=374655 RepID=A0A9W6J006_9HYPH|nr:iron ABC transporter permease [Hansschlegelia plantiphila]GLK66785.1 ABC transporter permease [Hansschlegelia plantiphila]